MDSEENPAILKEKIQLLADWIRGSYTFIGITGPELQCIRLHQFTNQIINNITASPKREEKILATKYTSAFPAPSHMAIQFLIKENIMKYLITENIDGMHRKTEVLTDRITELHGNVFMEQCTECHAEYMRDFLVADYYEGPVTQPRLCDDVNCDGILQPTLQLDRIPDKQYQEAMEHAHQSDLCVAFGVTTDDLQMSGILAHAKLGGGKVVVIGKENLGPSHGVDMHINVPVDQVLEELMEYIERPIPEFRIVRRLMVTIKHSDRYFIRFTGIDAYTHQTSIFRTIGIRYQGKNQIFENEPFELATDDIEGVCKVTLYFYGHYFEPEAVLSLPLYKMPNRRVYTLVFNPFEGIWESVKFDQGN